MKDYRDKACGFADLLQYGFMVDEGIMLLKDGSFCAGWSYSGPDMYSVDSTELSNVRHTFHDAFASLGDGWMLHSDLIRLPANAYSSETQNHFPDPTSLFLDNERRRHFLKEASHFVSSTFFVLTYKPPLAIESHFERFFMEANVTDQDKTNCTALLELFQTQLARVETRLSQVLQITRLTSERLLRHVHTCITGLDHPITLPKIPVYLDQLVASQDFIGGFSIKIGKKHLQVLGINGYPLESQPAMLQALSELPIAFRWSNRFICLDTQSAAQAIKKHRRHWFQKRQGMIGLVKEMFNAQSAAFLDQDALEMADDADNALQENDSTLMRYGYYTCVFILCDEDPANLAKASQLLTKTLAGAGFPTRIETVNAVEAYLGSLPGHGYQNIRRPLVSLLNLADFTALLSIWQGDAQHPCPYYPKSSPPLFYAQTQGKSAFSCNLHVGDVGHTLVLGDTGGGKSTLLGFLMAQQLRYPNAQIFLFDKGYSSFTLCHALGGDHYDLGGDQNTVVFAPLQRIDQEDELNWACGWLEGLYYSQSLSLNPLQRKEIRDSLIRLSSQPNRTLTHLQASLQDQALKAALEFYTLSGAMGHLLDAEVDGMAKSYLQVIEMEHLFNREEKFVLPLLDYLFHQIDRRLTVTKPSLIIIEEGHRFLKGHFGQKLELWLRECRKHNAAVIFVTQSVADITTSKYAPILLNSCPTKIFLPNPNALTPYNQEQYHHIGLSDTQIQMIAKATPKRSYYLTSPKGHRLMELALSPSFLTLMASTNETQRQALLALKAQHGNSWVAEYFLSKQLTTQASDWRSVFNTKKQD